MTPVYYVMDGSNVVISTTASCFKARAIRRNGQISLCVLAEEFPFPYLLVCGDATIEESGAAEVMRKIGGKMSGHPIPDSAMPAIEERARKEGLVVLRVQPTEFFSTMPLPQQPKGA